MPKIKKWLYIIFCCQCTSCIIFEEVESGILDTTEKIKKREIELKKRFHT